MKLSPVTNPLAPAVCKRLAPAGRGARAAALPWRGTGLRHPLQVSARPGTDAMSETRTRMKPAGLQFQHTAHAPAPALRHTEPAVPPTGSAGRGRGCSAHRETAPGSAARYRCPCYRQGPSCALPAPPDSSLTARGRAPCPRRGGGAGTGSSEPEAPPARPLSGPAAAPPARTWRPPASAASQQPSSSSSSRAARPRQAPGTAAAISARLPHGPRRACRKGGGGLCASSAVRSSALAAPGPAERGRAPGAGAGARTALSRAPGSAGPAGARSGGADAAMAAGLALAVGTRVRRGSVMSRCWKTPAAHLAFGLVGSCGYTSSCLSQPSKNSVKSWCPLGSLRGQGTARRAVSREWYQVLVATGLPWGAEGRGTALGKGGSGI